MPDVFFFVVPFFGNDAIYGTFGFVRQKKNDNSRVDSCARSTHNVVAAANNVLIYTYAHGRKYIAKMLFVLCDASVKRGA